MSGEREAITALVRPMAAKMHAISSDGRMTLLLALLAQEICMLPPSERPGALESVQDDLPGIVRATEAGMRDALAQNARDETP